MAKIECPVCVGMGKVGVDTKYFSFRVKDCDNCNGTGEIEKIDRNWESEQCECSSTPFEIENLAH